MRMVLQPAGMILGLGLVVASGDERLPGASLRCEEASTSKLRRRPCVDKMDKFGSVLWNPTSGDAFRALCKSPATTEPL